MHAPAMTRGSCFSMCVCTCMCAHALDMHATNLSLIGRTRRLLCLRQVLRKSSDEKQMRPVQLANACLLARCQLLYGSKYTRYMYNDDPLRQRRYHCRPRETWLFTLLAAASSTMRVLRPRAQSAVCRLAGRTPRICSLDGRAPGSRARHPARERDGVGHVLATAVHPGAAHHAALAGGAYSQRGCAGCRR